jgi:hypothetical protein
MVDMTDEVIEGTVEVPEGHFEMTLLGRTMLFKEITGGQRTALVRLTHRLRTQFDAAQDEQLKTDIIMQLQRLPMDVVETRFTNPDDRDWAEEQMLLGNLDPEDLYRVFVNGKRVTEQEPDDAAPAAPKKPGRKPAAKKALNARAKR